MTSGQEPRDIRPRAARHSAKSRVTSGQEPRDIRPAAARHPAKSRATSGQQPRDIRAENLAPQKIPLLYNRRNLLYWRRTNGVSLDKTSENLELHHETVFNMRHKILYCLEQEELRNPTQLEGVCEADETYLLESYKGKKLPSGFWRKARKHGAIAVKRGLSKEYICVCAGVERDGQAISKAVNRATAGKDDIDQVFGERVSGKTILLSDGATGYDVLGESKKCTVMHATEDNASAFFNINTVNRYHSLIKERNRNARGFATKYLNRYNALFSTVFRSSSAVVDDIFKLLCDRENRSQTILNTQTYGLLEI